MNILIVDDHPLTCQGLAALLQATQPQVQVHSAYSAEQAREALRRLPAPDWVFLDINLPDDPQHQLFAYLCDSPWIDHTVLISAEPEHRLVRSALAAGARGFIPKTADPALVLQGFERVLAGEFFVPPELAVMLQATNAAEESVRRLSPRLQQVQDLLLRGAANKVIARSLQLSDHTVKEYVSSVLTFHGVANRLELVLKLGGHRPT
ncbi:MAG: response regulator transcription factor [Rhodoferax sp.]|jgi:two-component system nitrate/nitrite response regulator NarL|uniref:response regulator n=1 Tax=Rhodoferax sp. TaxID=50421 RepID=UPI001B5F6C87|nr:response regulator transcription factor [Rhodoferax sp.]MBP8286335.1 response regulator transcription factor [Rhodoferax sp.]MBP9737908.1 response regulator transcription factor [Rhodoferax sp.]